jgi:hypothetical protein
MSEVLKSHRQGGALESGALGMACRRPAILSLVILIGALFGQAHLLPIALAAEEAPVATLAAQIRTQGFACDKPQQATLDAKQSKPDHDVWILECENATYRISRYPDMAAKVEVIR